MVFSEESLPELWIEAEKFLYFEAHHVCLIWKHDDKSLKEANEEVEKILKLKNHVLILKLLNKQKLLYYARKTEYR